jgi:hypothetical protein
MLTTPPWGLAMRYLVKIKFQRDDIDQVEFMGLLIFNDEQAIKELTRLENRDPMAYGRFCDAGFTRIKVGDNGKVVYRDFHSVEPVPPVAKIESWIKEEVSK